jgi:XTP/dITP diphosphohydrolase
VPDAADSYSGHPSGRHRLLIATGNAAKVREFAELLSPLGWDCISLAELARERGITIPEPEETGHTFRINACIKASEYARATACWTLADDSGLEVDALGGKPGVHSARWAEINGALPPDAASRELRDHANNRLLVKQLGPVPAGQRMARFVCVLALADPLGRIVLTTRGTVEGEVLTEPRGGGGFGYDPLFLIRDLGQTTAELDSEQKHRISHRGSATRSLIRLLESCGLCFSAAPAAVNPGGTS